MNITRFKALGIALAKFALTWVLYTLAGAIIALWLIHQGAKEAAAVRVAQETLWILVAVFVLIAVGSTYRHLRNQRREFEHEFDEFQYQCGVRIVQLNMELIRLGLPIRIFDGVDARVRGRLYDTLPPEFRGK